jgi:hypothetical protein
MPYIQTYSQLDLCQLTPEFHARTCNYWFVVQNACTAHTAFTTREQLETWLDDRGLSLTAPLVERGQHSYQKINGVYRRVSYMSYDEFYALSSIRQIKLMDNGRDTLALITEDPDGTRVINHLNCNCKYRIEYDWKTGAAMTATEYDKAAYGYYR